MTTAAFVILALFIGIALGYALAHFRAAAQLERAKAEAVRFQTQLETLQTARAELANQFQVLAAQILDAQTQKFTAQNRDALHALLGPLDGGRGVQAGFAGGDWSAQSSHSCAFARASLSKPFSSSSVACPLAFSHSPSVVIG